MRVLIKNKYVIDFFATVMFFTRIPIKWSFFSDKAPDLTKAAWAFPLVGFLIGGLSGLLGDFLIYLGLILFCSRAARLANILSTNFLPSFVLPS